MSLKTPLVTEFQILDMMSPTETGPLDLAVPGSDNTWIPPTAQMYFTPDDCAAWSQDPALFDYDLAPAEDSVQFDGYGPSHDGMRRTSSYESQQSSGSQTNSRKSPSSGAYTDADLRTAKRRAQNRLAQRTYRARKESAIKEHEERAIELEKEVVTLKTSKAKLEVGVQCLQDQIVELQRSVSSP